MVVRGNKNCEINGASASGVAERSDNSIYPRSEIKEIDLHQGSLGHPPQNMNKFMKVVFQ